jgi:hypothetical protein
MQGEGGGEDGERKEKIRRKEGENKEKGRRK